MVATLWVLELNSSCDVCGSYMSSVWQMQVPQPYGRDVFCDLVNRMPTTVLGGQFRDGVLFPKCPPLFLPPNVIWCTCYVHAIGPCRDKLGPQSITCMFFGYSRNQKTINVKSPNLHGYFTCEMSPFMSLISIITYS